MNCKQFKFGRKANSLSVVNMPTLHKPYIRSVMAPSILPCRTKGCLRNDVARVQFLISVIIEFIMRICNISGVNGFPTLNVYKDGEKVEEFNGKRTLDDLVAFVEKAVGAADEPEKKEEKEEL